MSTVTIKLAPISLMSEIYFAKDKVALVKKHLSEYTDAAILECEFSGSDAAEEMFDLTNNPSRQSERLELYGRQRSISVSDIVVIDNDYYLCDSVGWELLKQPE